MPKGSRSQADQTIEMIQEYAAQQAAEQTPPPLTLVQQSIIANAFAPALRRLSSATNRAPRRRRRSDTNGDSFLSAA